MGFLSVDHTIVVTADDELLTVTIGTGTLLNLTLIVLDPLIRSTDFWAQIGVLSGGTSADQRAAVLSNGYLGTMNAVFWNGFMPIADAAHVYAIVQGFAGATMRLSANMTPVPALPGIGVPRER